VPIVATPFLMTGIFTDFSSRYKKIAEVNDEYKLVLFPTSVEDEIQKIEVASILGNYTYCPEIADINGLASRYLSSDLNEYGIAVYQMGITLFPNYFEFHLALYDLYLPSNKSKAKYHLNTATALLEKLEKQLPEQQEILNAIDDEKKKNGW
jgi:hypothetical protein